MTEVEMNFFMADYCFIVVSNIAFEINEKNTHFKVFLKNITPINWDDI
jgi:hypothetical protein